MTVVTSSTPPKLRPPVCPPFRQVQVRAAGISWSGCWQQDGADLVVSSAYGCARERLGRAQPQRKAEQLLRRILQDWSTTGRPSGCD